MTAKTIRDLKVGDTVFVVYQLRRGEKERRAEEKTVIKVGRQYAYLDGGYYETPFCRETGQSVHKKDCNEGRFNREAMWIDGLYYPAIIDQVCDTCCGNGIVFRKDADEDDYGLDDMSCT